MTDKCKDCIYSYKTNVVYSSSDNGTLFERWCRRNAAHTWKLILDDDWCGEFDKGVSKPQEVEFA